MMTNDWSWLGDLPGEWNVPADLLEPTSHVGVNLSLRMLSSGIIGNGIVKLIGNLISEEAQTSIWFGTVGKEQLDPKQFLSLSTAALNSKRGIYDAWLRYVSAFEASGGMVESIDSEAADLVIALEKTISELAEIRCGHRS
jgi:hypothetical protein